ncbi:MAG: TerC family protein [Vulcanimicrobiota bacterium]
MMEGLLALLSLVALELVLGIDNLIFVSILAERLPPKQQAKARRYGLFLAVFMRILMLLGLSWLAHLTRPLMTIAHYELSGRDLVLLIGGLFLLAKTAHEIHNMLEPLPASDLKNNKPAALGAVIVQIALVDLVFSLDSVITAVGTVDDVRLMIAAVLLSVIALLWMSAPLASFVGRHPSMKMLALCFLMLIGTLLVAEGFGHHLPKHYLYFAMAFSLGVELLNIRARQAQSSARLGEF